MDGKVNATVYKSDFPGKLYAVFFIRMVEAKPKVRSKNIIWRD